MIMFITIGVIVYCLFFYAFFDKTRLREVKAWFEVTFGTLVVVAIIYGIIGGMIFAALSASGITPREWKFGWDNKIVAMKESQAYVVSRHDVEKSDRYYYMVDNGDNHYKQYWVNQNSSEIIEVENQPYVIKTYVQVRSPHNWFQRDLTTFAHILWKNDSDLDHKWEFYIPKGSIAQDFKVN